MTITVYDPSATQTAWTPATAAEYRPSGLAPERPAARKSTLRGEPRDRHSKGKRCRVCDLALDDRNKSGLCREHYRNHEHRPLTAKQVRDREPRRIIKAALRQLTAAARRGLDEDADEGLGLLLEAIPVLQELANDTGCALTERDGIMHVARTLGWVNPRTGAPQHQRVDERWGAGSRNHTAWQARKNGGQS